MLNLDQITTGLRGKVGDDSGLGATLKFDCGADGCTLIDGRSTPNTVQRCDADAPADCTVSMSLPDLNALVAGELDPAVAFMTGKLKIAGDMSVALKLQRVV